MGVQGVETGAQGGKFYEKGAEMGEMGNFPGREGTGIFIPAGMADISPGSRSASDDHPGSAVP